LTPREAEIKQQLQGLTCVRLLAITYHSNCIALVHKNYFVKTL